MTLVREILLSSVPPSNSLVSVTCIASGTTEKQGFCQVCRAWSGLPSTSSRITDANLDCENMKCVSDQT